MLEIQDKPHKYWLISHGIGDFTLMIYGTLFDGYIDPRIGPFNPWITEKLHCTHISFLRKSELELNNSISVAI